MSHRTPRRILRRPARLIAGGAIAALTCGLILAPGIASPALAVAAPYTQDFSSAASPALGPAGWSVESTNTTGMRAGWEGWSFHTTAEVVSAFGASGDRGSFGPGQMVREFDTVVFSAPLNTVQGPVKTQFGYHLLEVTSRQD